MILVQLWANVWIVKLRFDTFGYSSVFRTEYSTKGVMCVGGADYRATVPREYDDCLSQPTSLCDSDCRAGQCGPALRNNRIVSQGCVLDGAGTVREFVWDQRLLNSERPCYCD